MKFEFKFSENVLNIITVIKYPKIFVVVLIFGKESESVQDFEFQRSTVQIFSCADLENVFRKVNFYARISRKTNN